MIDVLYCGNSGVFDGVLTSMLSIFKRSRKDDFRFFIFTMDLTRYKESYTPISDELISFLDQVAKHYGENNVVKKIDVTSLYEKEMGRSPNEGAYCSPYTLLRLLADLVPEVDGDKLLYLDCDILFNRDIHLLYEQDVEGVEYAAARDHYGKFLLYPNYINAGVLLFNMKKCRETGLFPKTRVWINKKKLTFADQSALVRSTTKKKMLPQKFNDQKFLHKSTVVRHFSKRLFYLPYPHTDNIKQWHVDKVHRVFKYHAFDDILSEYLALKDEYLAGKGAYGGK
jgi:lipopolysaccharide biosynthesis glycosyltransferase